MEVIGVSGRVFGSLAAAGVNVILISQASSEHSICIAIKSSEVAGAKEAIAREFFHEIAAGEMDGVVVVPDMSIIAIVGENMRHYPGASGRLFQSSGETTSMSLPSPKEAPNSTSPQSFPRRTFKKA